MQNELLVYGKENTACPKCGMPLRKIFIGGRGTVYCPHCQPYKGHPFILAVTGPIHAGKSTVAGYYEQKGYRRIDADKIVSELYQKVESPPPRPVAPRKRRGQRGRARSRLCHLNTEPKAEA
jgi:uncharacterized Zn finger protein (UPF0148 family)